MHDSRSILNNSKSWHRSKAVSEGEGHVPNIYSVYTHSYVKGNGLLEELNASGCGVQLEDGGTIEALAYADDIVLLAEVPERLQKMLDIVHAWCMNWQVVINTKKTKIVPFRPNNVVCTDYNFTIGAERVEKVLSYKYLGIVLDCFADVSATIGSLASAGARALSQVIGKTKSNFNLGYSSYSTLFNSTVVPVMEYAVRTWSCGNVGCRLDQMQERAIRHFCGLPRMAPIHGYVGDMGWIPGIVRHDISSLRFYNELFVAE